MDPKFFPLILFFSLFLLLGCVQGPSGNSPDKSLSSDEAKTEGQICRSDSDCNSGVCDFIKQDFGTCAAVVCTHGTQAQSIADISFFCNQGRQWEKIKKIGDNCSYDYECFKRTGKDCPSCHPEDYQYYCKDHICVEESQLNECEQQGLKRITSKADADGTDGPCPILIAQRPERTVCASCGNGICDTDLESKCNCPEDCS